MTILYFSATGNNLYVAKELGGTILSIPQVIKHNKFVFEDDKIGLVFPVFGLCVPPYIENFMRHAAFHTQYLFSVITYGFYTGAAVSHLLEIADSRNLKFSYVETLKMVENYLPGFDMKKQKKGEEKKKIDKHLKTIKMEISAGKVRIHKDSYFDKMMTKQHRNNFAYPIGAGYSKEYTVTEDCSGCGVCQNVCPVDNIILKEGRPVFQRNCISCLSCIQNCPKTAIHMSSEKNEERFRNKHVSLQEIVAANQ